MATQVTTGLLANNAVTDDKLHADFTATTQSASDNSTSVATTAYVTTALANLVDSAPGTLNTLNELAAALGDDANFSTTVTNSIAGKLPLAGGTMTGHILLNNGVELRSKDTGGATRTITRINNSNELEYGYSGSGPVKFMGGGAYTEKMRIHTDGNIGIGAISPTETFVVSGDTNITGQMYLGPEGGNRRPFAKPSNWGYSSGYRAIVLGSASATYHTDISGAVTLSFNYDPSGNSNGAFSGNGNEILFRNGTQFVTPNSADDAFNLMNLCLKDGKVGIGTATPHGKLHIAETAGGAAGVDFPITLSSDRYQADYGVGIAFRPENQSTSYKVKTAILASGGGYGYNQADLHFCLNSNNSTSVEVGLSDAIMTLKKGGNVGIGTASPSYKLDVYGEDDVTMRIHRPNSGLASTDSCGIGFSQRGDASTSTSDTRAGIFSNYNGDLFLAVESGGNLNSNPIDHSALFIEGSNGNVGIGTTSPSNGKLHVAGADYDEGIIIERTDTSSKWGLSGYDSAGFQIWDDNQGNATRFVIDSSGNVSISSGHLYSNKRIFSGTSSTSATYTLNSQTTHGTWGVGSLNSSYVHHTTDRGIYYFNTRCEASGGFHTYSDENLKKEITTLTGALDSVAKMNGVTFKWKDADNRGGGSTGKQFGVTAQNMLTVDSELPTLNKDPLYNIKEDVKEDDEYYTMDYSRLSPYFIEAIKELKTKLEAAEARITELEG